MELLKQKIKSDGTALSSQVLLVDSFLNHRVEPELMFSIGEEFARLFADKGITAVATIESSGIAPAVMTAMAMNVPLLIMKKSTSEILADGILQTPVHSFTKNVTYKLTLKPSFLDSNDRVLLIDDFLANGEAALGGARLIEQTGARVGGIGIVIEKAFQPGRARLISEGYTPISLASVKKMDVGSIEFTDDM